MPRRWLIVEAQHIAPIRVDEGTPLRKVHLAIGADAANGSCHPNPPLFGEEMRRRQWIFELTGRIE